MNRQGQQWQQFTHRVAMPVQKISALRASASHALDDVGVSLAHGRSTVTNADENSLVWGRTPAQVPPLSPGSHWLS